MMKIRGTSHIAIAVSDMDRALQFYCDVLGFRDSFNDPQEKPGGAMPAGRSRHGVYLRWSDDLDATFIVLSADDSSLGRALQPSPVGVRHFSFWVDDLEATFEKISAAGVPIVLPPTRFDSLAWGEPPGTNILTTLFKDPDGTVIQLDQRVP